MTERILEGRRLKGDSPELEEVECLMCSRVYKQPVNETLSSICRECFDACHSNGEGEGAVCQK